MVAGPLAQVLVFEHGGEITFQDGVSDVFIVHGEGVEDFIGRPALGGDAELILVFIHDGEFGEVDAGGVVNEVDFLVPFANVTFIDPFFEFGKDGFLAGFGDFSSEVIAEELHFLHGAGVADSGEHEVGDSQAQDEAEGSAGHAEPAGAGLAVFAALPREEAQDHADEANSDDESENADSEGHPRFGFGDDVFGEAEAVVIPPKSREGADGQGDEIEEELHEILQETKHGKECEDDADDGVWGERFHGGGKVARERDWVT